MWKERKSREDTEIPPYLRLCSIRDLVTASVLDDDR